MKRPSWFRINKLNWPWSVIALPSSQQYIHSVYSTRKRTLPRTVHRNNIWFSCKFVASCLDKKRMENLVATVPLIVNSYNLRRTKIAAFCSGGSVAPRSSIFQTGSYRYAATYKSSNVRIITLQLCRIVRFSSF